jgi:hypothetical protein
MAEKTIRMSVIREPGPNTRGIIKAAPNVLAAFSIGDLSYECGSCDVMLLKNVRSTQVQHLVIQCGTREAYNEVPRIL